MAFPPGDSLPSTLPTPFNLLCEDFSRFNLDSFLLCEEQHTRVAVKNDLSVKVPFWLHKDCVVFINAFVPTCVFAGSCHCGQCICSPQDWWVSGEYCECDDRQCDKHDGLICTGNQPEEPKNKGGTLPRMQKFIYELISRWTVIFS